MIDKQTGHEIAELLEKLANGDSVKLGEFGDQSLDPDPAGSQAEALRELADILRGEPHVIMDEDNGHVYGVWPSSAAAETFRREEMPWVFTPAIELQSTEALRED